MKVLQRKNVISRYSKQQKKAFKMMPLRIILRVFQIIFLSLIIMYFNNFVGKAQSEKIPIGVVFEQNTDEIQNAFKFGMVQQSTPNRSRLDFQLYVDVINTADAFKLSRLICNQFARGVFSMLGAVSPDSFDTLHSYSNTFQMPFVTAYFPEKVIPPSSGLVDYAVSLRPDYHKAVIDTIKYYNWENIIYIYDSHDGLLRLQQLFQSLTPSNALFRISNVKRITNASEVVDFMKSIEVYDRWSNKYVILDASTQLSKDVIIAHVRDVNLGRRNYHYFLTGLVMDDRWEKEVMEYRALNITGFRLVDPTRKFVQDFIIAWKNKSISAKAALMFDAVQVLVDSIVRLLRKKPDLIRGAIRRNANANTSRIIDCNPRGKINPYEHGEKISRMIKKTEIEGLSGPIRFTEEGHRLNFSLQIVEYTEKGDLVHVASWYDHLGLVPVRPKLAPLDVSGAYNRNKTYFVLTIEEPPYFIRGRPDAPEGNPDEPIRGYCVDLARMIADKLEIKYEMRLVKDGRYGHENPKVVGGWDGLVGALVRKEVDMVIAPLIITVERETIIDFSRPYLSFNLRGSKNSNKDLNTIFSFLRPLSKETWLCILLSLFAVSVVMFVVSRFSPHEWKIISVTDSQSSSDHSEVATTKTTVVNEFSFWNSMWFSLGSFLQQGSDITPRSVSGRIVGTVWWFFTLIVVCSYTANLASYFTLTRITEPVHSYHKLATCPEDTLQKKVVTYTNEIHGNEDGWFAFLLDRPGDDTSSDTPCEMLVSATELGLQDFGVGFPKGSKLRDGVNLALMALKKEGELQKLLRKWFTRSECDMPQNTSHGAELSLSQVAGLFYMLMAGLVVALCVAVFEFCQYGRAEAARANVPLRAALRAKSRLNVHERKSPTPRTQQRDQERLGWNGGAFGGYYTPANQIGQEETALHASFTQV